MATTLVISSSLVLGGCGSQPTSAQIDPSPVREVQTRPETTPTANPDVGLAVYSETSPKLLRIGEKLNRECPHSLTVLRQRPSMTTAWGSLKIRPVQRGQDKYVEVSLKHAVGFCAMALIRNNHTTVVLTKQPSGGHYLDPWPSEAPESILGVSVGVGRR